jgi:PAS domain S-box-containing protein
MQSILSSMNTTGPHDPTDSLPQAALSRLSSEFVTPRRESHDDDLAGDPSALAELFPVFDEASCGLCLQTPEADGTILKVNPSLAAMLGYQNTELAKVPLSYLVHPEDYAEELRLAREMLEGRRAGYELERRDIGKTGGLITVKSSVKLISLRHQGRRAQLILRTVQDISQQKKLESDLLRMHRLHVLGRLTAGLVHKLGNSLSPLVGGIGLLRNSSPEDDLLEMLDLNLEHCVGVLKQVATLSEPAAAQPIPLDPAMLLQETRSFLENVLPRTVAVETRTTKGNWLIQASPQQLRQALVSLCIDAKDSFAGKGCIQLSATNDYVSSATASLHNSGLLPGPYVVIRIDTSSRQPQHLTTGLKAATEGEDNLSHRSVLHIIRAHKGFVEIQRAPGAGTSISLYLPVATYRASAGGARSLPNESRAARLPHRHDHQEILQTA